MGAGCGESRYAGKGVLAMSSRFRTGVSLLSSWVVVGVLASLAPVSASAAVSIPGGFTSLSPSRLLDTRAGVGAPRAPVVAGGTVALQVTGRGGVPASGVSAVVLNVTVTAPTRPGYLTVYANGTTRPTASNLNFIPAQTVPNLVIAPVGASGKVALYNGSTGTVQLIADVSGWFRTADEVLGPVTGVSAVPATTSIALSWTNPTAASFTGVMIRRALGNIPPTSPTAGALVVDAAKPATTYTNTGLTAGTQYSYALFAHNATPAYASAATVTSTTIAAVPGPVTGVEATPATTSIALSCTNPTTASFMGVMIRRALGNIPPTSPTTRNLFTDEAKPATTYTNTGLTAGTQYSYALFAHNATPAYAAATTVTSTTLVPGKSAYAWGGNYYGQLGNGANTNFTTPKQVGTATGWAAVSASYSHTVAVKTDGTLWAWGENGSGELGDGTTTDRL